MSTKVKIYNDEIKDVVIGEVPDFPKYTTQILICHPGKSKFSRNKTQSSRANE
jgi:hypothetical protein